MIMDPEVNKAIVNSIRAYWKGKDKELKINQGERRYSKDFFDKFSSELGLKDDDNDE